MVPASLPMPLLALLDLYLAAFTRCVRVPATLPHIYPGGAGTPAHSAHSVRKAMSPSNTRFSNAPLRPTPASPRSQVWTTLGLTVPFGSRFPSSGGWLSFSTLLARAFLQPCGEFEPILLLLSRVPALIVIDTETPGLGPGLLAIATSKTPLLELLHRVLSIQFMSFLCFYLTTALGR